MLLVQSIQITDKFGFEKQTAPKPKSTSSETVFIASDPSFCVNGLGNYSQYYFSIFVVFLTDIHYSFFTRHAFCGRTEESNASS